MKAKSKILVIGAGPAGLSTRKALKSLSEQDYQIICLEKQSDWSGQWNYSWRSGTDKYGEHVHSSMYSQLWTNFPKEIFEFPDYTFQEHFGKSVLSYLPRQVYKGYFMKRLEKQGLRKYIKFNCTTKNVQWIEKESKFEVRYTKLDANKDFIELFDFVIVATGHYSYPHLPDLKGIELFKRKVAHSHELRQFNQFKDKNVLVLGGSFSAQDVTLQCYKYGAKNITWAYRRLKVNYQLQNLPENIQLRTGLSHFDESYAYFENGEKKMIDVVLLCTGYIHHYPFLEQNLRLECHNHSIVWPEGLYYSVVWEKNPKLFYSGMGNYGLCQIIFDIQGHLIRDIISGKYIVPDYLKQRRHPKDLQRENDVREGKQGPQAINSVVRYAEQLIELTGYPRFEIENCIPIFNKSVKDREENFITYRDASVFQSFHTGQLSCEGSKSWLEMKDVQLGHHKSQQQLKEFFQF